jgi:hypothetical protein
LPGRAPANHVRDAEKLRSHQPENLHVIRGMNCRRKQKQPDSKRAGLGFHGLKLAQAGSEGLSLFSTTCCYFSRLQPLLVHLENFDLK